ncbi:MAG: GH25 family lysozyme [Solirubrobacterales bacterium]
MSTSARFARTASAAVAVLGFASAWLALPVAVAQEGPGPSFTAGAPVVVEQPAGSLPGIDVSHWQESIDWAQVAASGQRFAIAKATEGRSYVDPMYATNAAGATANGIMFGAYHFAKPDDTPNDAVLEADHFVDVAQLAPGNLVPALDIERTGGLTQAELTQWILTWLGRVTERLGVKPMVYTSPHGWLVRTGDTTAVADAGYTILWVAHWDVSSPTLPANDWQGNGWTFWQYTDCGTVPGIVGCVDLDWFARTSFEGVTIPSPDVTPPTVTITPSSDPAGSLTVAFSEVVHQVTADNTVLYRPDASAYEDATITCRSGKGIVVDCLDGSVRMALVEPTDPLIPGETYQAVVNLPGALPAVVDRSGNPAPTTQAQFATPTELEQDSPAVSYGWRTVPAADARGGSYLMERRAGATASFAFVGRSVSWITMTGPTQGRAAVSIDGSRIGVFDQYSAGKTFGVERRIEGLSRGEHVVAIRVLGKASAASSDTLVAVDGFEVGTDRVPTPDLDLAWGRAADARASGGSYVASDLKGSSLELTFRGTGIEWSTLRGPRQGRAAIYVDGALVRTVDNYANQPTFGVIRTVSGLSEGLHTLRIVVVGEGRPAADGTLVSADAFSVIP